MVGFVNTHHRQCEHTARSDAADKAPDGVTVVSELRAADKGDAADGENEAEHLRFAQAFAEKEETDGGEEKYLQAVEQGGNTGADGVYAFVPQRQVECQKHAGEHGGVDGFSAFGQLLPKEARQQPENHRRYRQPPKCDGVRADFDKLDNQAAQSENDAADDQQRGGMRMMRLIHNVLYSLCFIVD